MSWSGITYHAITHNTQQQIDLVPCGGMDGDLPACTRVKSPIWKGSAKQLLGGTFMWCFGERVYPSPYKDMSYALRIINDTNWLSDSVKWLQDILVYRISVCSIQHWTGSFNFTPDLRSIRAASLQITRTNYKHTKTYLFINTAHRHLTQAHIRVCPSSQRSIDSLSYTNIRQVLYTYITINRRCHHEILAPHSKSNDGILPLYKWFRICID